MKKILSKKIKDFFLSDKCLQHSMKKILSKNHGIGAHEVKKDFILL